MHKALAVDDMDVGTAFQHPLHNLAAGNVLRSVAGEQGDYSSAQLDMAAENREESHSPL